MLDPKLNLRQILEKLALEKEEGEEKSKRKNFVKINKNLSKKKKKTDKLFDYDHYFEK